MSPLLAEIGRFFSVGVANTLVGLAVIYAAKWFLGLGDVAANALGYSTGLLLSFTLNRRWTFGHVGAHFPAFVKFVIVVLVAYAANLATVVVAIRDFGVDGYVAQACGIVPYAAITYLASKFFVFRRASVG